MNNTILHISSSAQNQQAISTQLGLQLAKGLQSKLAKAKIIERNLNNSELALLDNEWVAANFTPEEERNQAQQDKLSVSDSYVEELLQSNIIIIGSPIYNFSVPAALKAYIDLICRARSTFKYTENGPVGLLQNKKAYVVLTSGGVAIDSPVDFATPYIKQVFNFIGVKDITIIDAAQMNSDKDGSKIALAKNKIENIITQY